MTTVTIEYELSEKGRKDEVIATGDTSGPARSVTIDLADLDEHLRQELLACTEFVSGTKLRTIFLHHWPIPGDFLEIGPGTTRVNQRTNTKQYDAELTPAQAIAEAIKQRSQKDVAAAVHQARQAKLDAQRAEEKRSKEAVKKLHAESNALYKEVENLLHRSADPAKFTLTEEQLNRDARIMACLKDETGKPGDSVQSCLESMRRELLAEREEVWWVRENGSEHLNDLMDGGFEWHEVYQHERLTQELPGGWKFTDKTCESHPIETPNSTQLDMLKEMKALHPALADRMYLAHVEMEGFPFDEKFNAIVIDQMHGHLCYCPTGD